MATDQQIEQFNKRYVHILRETKQMRVYFNDGVSIFGYIPKGI